jgi:hypothetical protein
MSYSNDKGKYQKAYDFLFKKLVPSTGKSGNNLGEALRLVNKVVSRHYNDGDTYSDCIHNGMVPEFSKGKFPFDGEHKTLGLELEYLLDKDDYDGAMNLVLLHIMMSLSSDTAVYNPESNRLAAIDSPAGRKALVALDINSVHTNTCGKGERWLAKSLREEGVKIVKRLSPETLKELNCETLVELYKPIKTGKGKRTKKVKVEFSKDRSALSKKFSKMERQHKKSIRDAEKSIKMLIKRRKEFALKEKKLSAKKYKEAMLYYQELESLTSLKRVEGLKKLINNKLASLSHYSTKMLLLNLANQKTKVKDATSKTKRERRADLINKLVKEINTIGKLTVKLLKESFDPDSDSGYVSLRSRSLELDEEYTRKLENLLEDVMGSAYAVNNLYEECCRYN